MTLIHGDCLEELKKLPENSIDAVVTDPPYGLSFMGKKWDYDVPSVEIWQECLRVLKPGGYLLSFAGTRTQHRMAVRIEDAGFEIRDMIAWIYGSGFPKSTNIAIRIDKEAGKMEARGKGTSFARKDMDGKILENGKAMPAHKGITEEAKQWEGWGTALKPALEPITVARKPIEGTVAENCLKWGVGGINIDECRVGTEVLKAEKGEAKSNGKYGDRVWDCPERTGRFPANLIHDGSEEVLECFPNTKSGKPSGIRHASKHNVSYADMAAGSELTGYGDSGSAARFFYCAKASKKDRDEGLEGFPLGEAPASARSKPAEGRENALGNPRQNHHPTVKPTALMEYLVRLVSREGSTILDPFMGSGTTGIACKKLKRHFIGIEKEAEYIKIAQARIDAQPTHLL